MTEQGESLGEILSGETVTTETPGAEATTTTESVQRDDHGRFAPKAGDTTTVAPTTEQPAAVTTTEEQPGATVPLAALHAERQKNADLGRQISELNAKFDGFSRAQPRPTPAQPQEQPKPKDFWDNPDEFVQQALSPLQQQMQRQRESISRMMAVSQHGQEKVGAAFSAIREALATNPQAGHDYQRIMASDHPYDELVQWHGRTQTLSRIGGDPDAWLKAEVAKMLADPAQAGELLKQIQQGAAGQTTIARSQAPATPPPSITRIPGGNATEEGVPTLGDILKERR